jgi:hypothetical protein
MFFAGTLLLMSTHLGGLTFPRLGKSHEQGGTASESQELDLSSPDSQHGTRVLWTGCSWCAYFLPLRRPMWCVVHFAINYVYHQSWWCGLHIQLVQAKQKTIPTFCRLNTWSICVYSRSGITALPMIHHRSNLVTDRPLCSLAGFLSVDCTSCNGGYSRHDILLWHCWNFEFTVVLHNIRISV